MSNQQKHRRAKRKLTKRWPKTEVYERASQQLMPTKMKLRQAYHDRVNDIGAQILLFAQANVDDNVRAEFGRGSSGGNQQCLGLSCSAKDIRYSNYYEDL